MIAQNLAVNPAKAQRLIRAGEVRVNGELVDQPGTAILLDAAITLKAKPRFVSRGGEKLAAALATFPACVADKVVADIGASTGGFTDCLLQHKAAKVYAIDVGYGHLAWKLRQDVRVVVMERTNARYVEALPESVDMLVSDVSFISLRLIYTTAVQWLQPAGTVISLIKPQFEAGRQAVGKGGVVRDPAVHRQVLERVTATFTDLDLGLRGLRVSPLRGPAGNVEFLGWWQRHTAPDNIGPWIEVAMQQAAQLIAPKTNT